MAFDIPVEADRVDLSFSSRTSIAGLFMRVPMILIGFLLYLLVGFCELPTDENNGFEDTDDETEACLPYSSIVIYGPMIPYYQDPSIKSALKNKNNTKCNEHFPPRLVRFESVDSSSTMDDDLSHTSSSSRPKKSLKWADENGHCLVNVVHF
eukprot:scaffold1991_cov158-Amphora_coffeaeformis.AAC.4